MYMLSVVNFGSGITHAIAEQAQFSQGSANSEREIVVIEENHQNCFRNFKSCNLPNLKINGLLIHCS